MKINEIIRTLRKEQNLTQEQVANYLGVTAPAVNKWENGISYPDITLLAPLARVLKTNVDTLLSFKEELTDHEIDQFVKEISGEITSIGYKETFEKVKAKIHEYPNCEKLILYGAQIMNGYLNMKLVTIDDHEKYKKQILSWFEDVAFSEKKELANMALMSLSQNYITDKNYEEAQKLLDKIPPMGFDKRVTQANLYYDQGLYEKAYEVHEGMVFQYANSTIASLMQIVNYLCDEKDYDKALEYACLAADLADRLDLGDYIGVSSKLLVFLKMKNVEESITTLETMMNAIDTIGCAKDSKLYSHMKFKENGGIPKMKQMIIKSLGNDEVLDFLRDDIRFKSLMNKLTSVQDSPNRL